MNNIIEKYVRNMTINDVNSFAFKHGVNLSDKELNFTYKYIKENWQSIIKNPNGVDLDRYSDIFSSENLMKIRALINEYSKKYQSFL